MNQYITTQKTVLLVGATGGIGLAMLEQLAQQDDICTIFATYRDEQKLERCHDALHKTLDADHLDKLHTKTQWVEMAVTEEASIIEALAQITAQTNRIDWVINTVGLLHTTQQPPEKTIRHFEPEFFMQNMMVNAMPSLLIAKHIKPLLKSAQRHEENPAIFATISARVGSISDNRMGGWYSYRMSKTALNMGMKNLAIEWGRGLKNVCVVVLQPGTVDTELSKPFQKNVAQDKLFTPAVCAKNLLQVMADLQACDTGSFLDWAGQPIEW